MSDTTREVARVFQDLMMSRSGTERLLMGSDMFDTAREIIMSSLGSRSAPRIRQMLFLRLYGSDFEPSECERIIAAINGRDSKPF